MNKWGTEGAVASPKASPGVPWQIDAAPLLPHAVIIPYLSCRILKGVILTERPCSMARPAVSTDDSFYRRRDRSILRGLNAMDEVSRSVSTYRKLSQDVVGATT